MRTCGLFLRPEAVWLVFPRGEQLPDPHGLMEGRKSRYVTLCPGAVFPEECLVHLLVAALLIGARPHS